MNDLVQNMVSSLTGNLPKAILEIRTIPTAAKAGALPKGVATGAADALANGVTAPTAAFQDQKLTVQYNPSSLSFQANAEAIPFSQLQKNLDNGVPNQQVRPPSITMSVDLVFDDMNVKDAFMAEKGRVSAGDIITDVSAVIKTVQGKRYSVQKQTNGLVAMLMRKETRQVTFRWADLRFSGEVTQAQAQYNMFSVSGRPIRSTVRLVILQRIDSLDSEQSWNAAFDAVFQDSLTGSTAGETLKNMGSLINIKGF